MSNPKSLAEAIYPVGAIDPSQCYVRVAEVLWVDIYSVNMTIKFLDEPQEKNFVEPYNPRANAIACVCGEDPLTTYTVSAAAFGRGDRVAVVVYLDKNYVVSSWDTYLATNVRGYALIHEFALLDVLSELCIDVNYVYEQESYADFYNPKTNQVTRIKGIPHEDKNRFLNKILLNATSNYHNLISRCKPTVGFVTMGGGPLNVPIQKIHGSKRVGDQINGLKVVHQIPFSQTDLTGNLSAWHPTEPDLELRTIHSGYGPSNAQIKTYNNATVIWFNDVNPDYVLLIVCYPAWATIPTDEGTRVVQTLGYVNFIEVPVYGFSERKRTNDILKDIVWQKYEDNVRLIHTIYRSYLDLTIFDNTINNEKYMNQALSIFATRIDENDSCSFGYVDGYGYDSSGQIVTDAWRVRQVIGSIQRTKNSKTTDPDTGEEDYIRAANGSPYTYNISNTNPMDGAAIVTNWYYTDLHYWDDDAGNAGETQVMAQTTKDTWFLCLTDGINDISKKIDLDYTADGKYDVTTGKVSWSDAGGSGGSFIEFVNSCYNEAWEYIYYNRTTLIATNYFKIEKSAVTSQWSCNTQLNFIHFVDLELELYVIEELDFQVANGGGPGTSCTGDSIRRLVVLFGGTKYLLWEHSIPVTTFPDVMNFVPWVRDSSWPTYGTFGSPPYDYQNTRGSLFWWFPFLYYFQNPKPEYMITGVGIPIKNGSDPTGIIFPTVSKNDGYSTSDYLAVDIDTETDSWVVRSKCWLPDPPQPWPDNGYVDIPNGLNLYRFNGQSPTFTKPSTVYKTIEVDPSKMNQEEN